MPKLNKINEAQSFGMNRPSGIIIYDYIVEDEDLTEILMTLQLYREKDDARTIVLKESDVPKDLLAAQPDAFHADDEFSGFDFDYYFPAIIIYTFTNNKITQEDICRAYIKHVQQWTV